VTRISPQPLLEGLNGASELSGAGASYVLARWRGPDGDNRDLAALAVVGAVGDMQDSDGGLIGANEAIVADGVDAGVIETRTDLDLYGRQTRPLPKLLEYASDVKIPGVSNDEAGAISFLTDLDIEVKRDGEAALGRPRCRGATTDSRVRTDAPRRRLRRPRRPDRGARRYLLHPRRRGARHRAGT